MGVFEDVAKCWVTACCPADMGSTPRFDFLGVRCLSRRRGRARRDGVLLCQALVNPKFEFLSDRLLGLMAALFLEPAHMHLFLAKIQQSLTYFDLSAAPDNSNRCVARGADTTVLFRGCAEMGAWC